MPFTNPINVTAYGSTAEALVPKNVYSMNCKFIGSNDDRDDHLHFEHSTRINLGPVENFPETFLEELLDKVSIVAMGIVVAREIIRDPAYQSKPTVVVTLKSTDYDPIVSPSTVSSMHCACSDKFVILHVPRRLELQCPGCQSFLCPPCVTWRRPRTFVSSAGKFNL